MSGKNDTTVQKRRRKVKENTETNESDSEEEESNEPMETNPSETVVAHDDGVFTVMINN